MRVTTDRVAPVWVLSVVKQHSHDLYFAELRCKRECPMAVFVAAGLQQPMHILNASQSGCEQQVQLGAPSNYRFNTCKFSMHGHCSCRAVRVGSIVAEKV